MAKSKDHDRRAAKAARQAARRARLNAAPVPEEETGTVGYGRPPRHTQFKPGVSGNPKGRPKGAKGFHALLSEGLAEMVTVRTPNGRMAKFSKLKVIVTNIITNAVNRDPKAIAMVAMFDARRSADAQDSDGDAGPDATLEAYLELMKGTKRK